ncbi:MAG: hypothetical protein IJS44_05185 [Clostridia bacterium]|nr:hypothetical protein [Clostridia bacterium]
MINRKSMIVKILAIMLILSTLFAIASLPAAAAVYTTTATARSASDLLAKRKATFSSLRTNKITVMNKGSVPMWMYINGCWTKEIQPGKEYTYSQYGYRCRTFYVQVYAKNPSYKRQTVTIKTTSGSLTNY